MYELRNQIVEHLFFLAINPQYPIILPERMEVVKTTVSMLPSDQPGVDIIQFSHYVKETF